MEYVDSVEDLRVFYFEENFKNKKTDTVEYWAVVDAMEKMYNNLDTDPVQILEEIKNNYEINSIFSNQKINKENNNIAANAIDKMIKFIERRRN